MSTVAAYRRLHDVRNESDLQLRDIGRFAIERGLAIVAMQLFHVALHEELLHDLLGGLHVDRPGFCGVGNVRCVQEDLQEHFRIGRSGGGVRLSEVEVRGHSLD